MKPKLKRLEIEPVRRGDHDLPVDHAAGRQIGTQRLVQLRKVAIERPQVPALDEDFGLAAKDDGAKPIPLRFIQEGTARQLLGELRQHRLDRAARSGTRRSSGPKAN